MARLPDAFIDDLLARTDLVEIVGARVPLKRQGKDYSARCPFHDERSPSFNVSPSKQFYHCFGCGAHGTAISFLMNFDRLEFLDAVEELAKRAGVEVPRDTRSRNESEESRGQYEQLTQSSAFFQQQLAKTPKALDYLERRGVDAENRTRFSIGYAPESFDALKNQLGRDEASIKCLERTGMLSKSDNGRVYDKFRDRIMFPIHDRRGRVIAFGGRVLAKDDGPKYLNSPETPLFHKGRELYGLWQVRQAHAKIPRLIVVEGYMDVVALFQYGVDTAVATLGTATTPEHAELLFRNSADVYFCFDGDRAGRNAAWKAVESIIPRMKDGRQAWFLFLPDGEDPDSIVRKEGAAGFDTRLQTATPLSEFFFAELGKDITLSGLEGKARLAERCKPLLLQIPDGAFRDLMQQRLTELTGVGAVIAAPPARAVPVKPTRATATSQRPSLVRNAISHVLLQPALASQVPRPYAFAALRQPGISLLIELLDTCRERPDLNTGGLLDAFSEHADASALQKLALQNFPGEDAQWRAEFFDAIIQLEKQTRSQRIEELQHGPLSDTEKTELRELLLKRN